MSRSRRQPDKAMSAFTLSAGTKRINTYIGNDFTKGRRGMARAVAGAKKFGHSRRRCVEQQEAYDNAFE